MCSIAEWRWIPTKQNVGEEATKWTKKPKIDNECRWFKGPNFILIDETDWPEGEVPKSTEEESKYSLMVISQTLSLINFKRFSK